MTSSRNRYGQYRRTRATPVNPASSAQVLARARLQTNAAAWRSLTDAQRAGWTYLGSLMTRTDSLGQTYTLTGFQAYASVNGLNLAAGASVVEDAPALITPDPVTLGNITLTPAEHTVAFTPTPLGAGERVFLFASPQRSAGRGFENDLRLVAVTAAAATSPTNIATAYTARFGVPVAGNRIFYSVARFSGGFLSTPAATSQVVASAP